MSPIRVLLVDDNPKFIAAAAYFLTTLPEVTVVGYALSAQEGLAQATNSQPNLVLMDIAMPHMNGLEATRELKTWPHAPYVIILTMYDNLEYRAAAKLAGADGFVTKSEFGAQLPLLIQTLFGTALPDTFTKLTDLNNNSQNKIDNGQIIKPAPERSQML
jgi:DNA-binding NarL/FixJ family response regulator